MSQGAPPVVNASPLIFLAKIDRLEHLPEPVATTPTVLEEVTRGDPVEHPEAPLIATLAQEGRIQVSAPGIEPPEELTGLHEGEASVLALAIEQESHEAILDDRAAIRAARLLGIEPVSTPFLLLRACRAGEMTAETYQRCLDRLIAHRYFLSADLYQQLVEAAGRRG